MIIRLLYNTFSGMLSSMIHVLFDIDATLLHVSQGIDRDASSVMFQNVFGIEAHEEMIENVGKTEFGIITEVLEKVQGVPVTVPIQEEAYKVWAEADLQEIKKHPVHVLPGIPELLQALSHKENMQLSLLTGNSSYRSKVKIQSAGLERFFTDADGEIRGVFGEMSPRRSELVDIVKKQVSDAEHFVIIDDSRIGAQMAKEHALPFIAVATGNVSEEELRTYTPYVFPDFGEGRWQKVVAIIEQI
ncbi:MAG TPA: HAD hydrolase-like protein [Patescibacteria group bacterium]|nr:HAD hydrolase-like protein [Patescibacteria group bacterium]